MAGRTFFRDFISSKILPEDHSVRSLPLLHGAKAIRVRDIIETGALETGPECSVLKQNLIFTFYGRPAYKVRPDNEAIGRPVAAPCFFLVKPELLKRISQIHALDTGAFATEFYRHFVDIDLNAEDFGIMPDAVNINALVRFFFGNSKNYFQVRPREDLSIPSGQHEATSYYDMMTNNSNAVRYDDRSSSIECVFDDHIEITSNTIEAVLLPTELADDEHYGNALKDLGIECIFYNLTPGLTSSNHVTRIYDAVENYYKVQGYLK